MTRITRTITPLTVLARGRDELRDAVRAADADTVLDDLAESEGARDAALKAKLAEVNALNLALLEENEQSEGALVFTDRAKSSWADCAYEDFQGMWEALDALADLAQA